MSGERQTGLTFSALLHLLVLAFALWGLPEFFNRPPPPEPAAITVELLPIGKISNVKNSPRPKPKKEARKKEPKKKQPPVKKADAKKVAAPPPVEKKDAKKKADIKKKKEKKKAKKKKQDDLAAVLAAVKQTAQKQKKKHKNDGGERSKSDQYDPTIPLSLSEKDAIRNQFIPCWVMPAGAKDAHELYVTLRLELRQDGVVIRVDLADNQKSRYASDPFFRAAADSAIRAVHKCSPLKNLPADKYSTWRDMELNFNPKDMLY